MTWYADKINQPITHTLNGFRYAFSFDDEHNLFIFGKKKSQNIHEKGDYYNEYEPNREGYDRIVENSGYKQGHNISDMRLSDDGTAAGENDPILNSKEREQRESDGRGRAQSDDNAFLQEEKTKYQYRANLNDESNRALLVNALESSVKNEIELRRLNEY